METSTLVSLVFSSGREMGSGASAELGSHRDEDWETENHDTLHYPFTNHDKVMYTLLHFFLIVREKNKSSGSCRRFMELVDSPCIVLNQAARKGRQSLVQLASMGISRSLKIMTTPRTHQNPMHKGILQSHHLSQHTDQERQQAQ